MILLKGRLFLIKHISLIKNLKKLVIEVHPKANKPMVKEALEKLFNVEVEKVSIVVRKGKNTTSSR